MLLLDVSGTGGLSYFGINSEGGTSRYMPCQDVFLLAINYCNGLG